MQQANFRQKTKVPPFSLQSDGNSLYCYKMLRLMSSCRKITDFGELLLMKKRLLILLLAVLVLTGCAGASDPEASRSSSRYLTSMDTVMKLTAYGARRETALDAAQAEILRLDSLLSTGLETSEVSRLNREGSACLSEDSEKLYRQSAALFESTGGAFDITVYPLVQLWGFSTKQYHIPTEAELTEALSRVGASRIVFRPESREIVLGQGQAIDFGGIAKGYTSQRVIDIFQQEGIRSAMISLGGNIQCLGSKPDGNPWKIGIRDPWDENGIYAAVQVVDKAVITSGGYERFFVDEATGKTYRHILDPRTGVPAESGLSSVSIVTADGTLGDGLSTALYILGLEEASVYWRSHSDSFEAILICDDGSLYATEGLKDRITSEHLIHWILKKA